MIRKSIRRQIWFVGAAAVGALMAASVAFAVGWTNVGSANLHLNSQPSKNVITSSPVYPSQMRLNVTTHSPCGGNNFYMGYSNPDGSVYMQSTPREICNANETPSMWPVGGGNKYALCGEVFNEPTDPASTCQRYSTT